MLKINNLCKNFGDITILKDISIAVKKCTIIGLAGTSGSGKSTLLRCIQGLETVTSGEIIFNENKNTLKSAFKSAFMFQDFQLFPHMTVMENLIYAPKIHDKIKPSDKIKSNYVNDANHILKTLGILDKKNSSPDQLSGGQKQRVALARSLMMHPKLLLCDEPTSGLDVATIDDVVILLKSIRDMDVTMIIASHDLDFITKIADRIIVLKKGEISLEVNHKSVKNPIQLLKKYY